MSRYHEASPKKVYHDSACYQSPSHDLGPRKEDPRLPPNIATGTGYHHHEESSRIDGMAPSNVALFKIDTTEKLKVCVLNTAREACCPIGEAPQPKVVCHPYGSLLAFFFPKVSLASRVMLWNIAQGSNTLSEVYVTSEISLNKDAIEDVHFSRDGNHLVIQTSTSTAPEVIPIDSIIPSTKQVVEQTEFNKPSSTTSQSSSPAVHVSSASRHTQLRPTTSVATNDRASGTSIVHASNQITIRQWSSSDDDSKRETKDEVLRLTRLPAWDTLGASSVDVRVPQAGDNKLRIVLNKSARQWDDMVQNVDVHLPALVSRDMASLEIRDSNGRFQQLRDTRQLRDTSA
ncbi:hypothetical protein C7974DRAFT_374059 [Boeremia exigua]|uniref:uncharacterized protein n=1 Tax=Boeremia exigua TaxID=749465 RepID=UPI001E8D80F9|nr:uncharacterized protein C7974DRAFT_374059 [Boeremia exigua]KAH6639891.1 hypothetical protein C7974DRAFT_374059 [Boeremia exigua]